MSEEEFKVLCNFNICEEEKEKDIGDYKAIIYSKLKLTLNDPRDNNWEYSELINKEILKIVEEREGEFKESDKYDYSIEIIIEYQIKDKTSVIILD